MRSTDPRADLSASRAVPRDIWRAVVWAVELVRAFLVGAVRQLFVDSFRSGRVDLRDRPSGTRWLAAIVAACYVLAVAAIVLAERLRGRARFAVMLDDGGGTVLVPRHALWPTLLLLLVCLALLVAGALHVTVWAAVPLGVVVASGLVSMTVPSGGRPRLGLAVVAASIATIAIYAAVRRRRAALPAADVAVVLLLMLPCAVWSLVRARDAVAFGTDPLPAIVQLAMLPARTVLVVLAVVGGAGVATFALTATEWCGDLVRERFGRRATLSLVVALAAWRTWTSVRTLRHPLATSADGRWGSQLGAVLLVALVVLVWIAIDRLADRRARGATDLPAIRDALGRLATPVALVLTAASSISIIAVLLAGVAPAFGGADLSARWSGWWRWATDSTGVRGERILLGIGLLVAAVHLARRSRRGTAELCGVVGVVLLVALSTAEGAWLHVLRAEMADVDRVGLVVTLALLVRWGATRTLTGSRLDRLLVVLILTALLTERTFVTDPIGRLIGFTGIGFVLFGFVWTFLTTGAAANEGSAAFPRDSRMVLFWAQNLFGVVLLAFAALARSPRLGGAGAAFGALGDEVLGVPLLLAATVAMLAAAIADRQLSGPPLERAADC